MKDPAEVIVHPDAFCSMILHAAEHKSDVVHGALLGSFDETTATLSLDEAVPIAHTTPTQPLLETAIGLIETQTETRIVGWYTAPALLHDQKPGPVAMRIASNLETSGNPVVLIVLNNSVLGDVIKGDGSKAKEAVQAFGKDFGKQFQEAIKTTVHEGDGACQALLQASTGGLRCNDLEDNMDEPSSTWYPNKALTKMVQLACESSI